MSGNECCAMLQRPHASFVSNTSSLSCVLVQWNTPSAMAYTPLSPSSLSGKRSTASFFLPATSCASAGATCREMQGSVVSAAVTGTSPQNTHRGDQRLAHLVSELVPSEVELLELRSRLVKRGSEGTDPLVRHLRVIEQQHAEAGVERERLRQRDSLRKNGRPKGDVSLRSRACGRV